MLFDGEMIKNFKIKFVSLRLKKMTFYKLDLIFLAKIMSIK